MEQYERRGSRLSLHLPSPLHRCERCANRWLFLSTIGSSIWNRAFRGPGMEEVFDRDVDVRKRGSVRLQKCGSESGLINRACAGCMKDHANLRTWRPFDE
jgi:hypothetical protein